MPQDAQPTKLYQRLTAYKEQLDPAIEAYCERLLRDCERTYTPYSQEVAAAFCAILRRGGKRLRGALVMNAYEMLGGTDHQLSLKAAQIIEMIHAYLLIIDDIFDHSLMRRGGPAAHVLLTERHRELHLKGDSEHFGMSQAVNAALLGMHLAHVELTQLPVTDSLKLEVLHDLNEILIITIHGQINDVYNEVRQEVSEAQVERTLTLKTAYYTFQGPLQTGAMLAGADSVSIGVLEVYAKHMGLAYQIADDILGTFGNSFESGKSALDDIKEGKITLLISRALERANPTQEQQLLAALGNQQLTPTDHEATRQILEETGALDYARQRANQHAADAVTALETAPRSWSPEGVQFLRDLARFVTERHA